MSLLTEALDLAAKGWSVFPCGPTGVWAKKPLTKHGYLDASLEPEVIRAWWQRWPNAMIGASVPASRLVLDIDPRNGGSLDALEALAGPVPETLTAWSGRGDGGRHLYFKRPYGQLTSTRLPKGIDLKVNGYLILPPSIHPVSGKPYHWELRPVAQLTPQLREVLRPLRPLRMLGTSGGRERGAPLVRMVSGLKEGGRNRGLFWAACRAAEKGILAELSPDLVTAAYVTGMSEQEALRVIASAARTVK